jgi:pyruvate dehydrogenase E2 component (dihydrolipoamide acetyltransferase)
MSTVAIRMVTDVVMPRYSLTMLKGTIVKWLKKKGEPIEKGEPLVEVEADKVTTEVESPVSGVLLKICALEDTEVLVGESLAFIGHPGEPLPEIGTVSKGEAAHEMEDMSKAPTRTLERVREETEKVRASPLARRLSKQQGVDLAEIRGTGPRGRVTREDVLRFIELHRDTRAVKEIIPVTGMQKTIAERMSQSIKVAAHCSVTIEVDASRMVSLRQRINAKSKAERKNEVSFTDILVKAVAIALKENPILNSTLEGDRLKVFEDVNIGVAVDVETDKTSRLLVPVVRRANEKSLTEISEELRSLIEQARRSKLSHEDLTGGTFTITNLGMYRIETFQPIINPPETAILGVGSIIKRPFLSEQKVKVRPLMHLTLSFDHRVVNGAPAARFMQRLKQILEEE